MNIINEVFLKKNLLKIQYFICDIVSIYCCNLYNINKYIFF